MRAAVFALALVVLAFPLRAEETRPVLSLPIDCTPWVDCWIVNYVDMEPAAGPPGEGAIDKACGAATYDGHKGTDFAVRDMAAVRAGVAVLAAAPGLVIGTRDGMPDRITTPSEQQRVKGRECGNGIRVEHDGGWFSQYCHLLEGSITVGRGQRIKRGQVIGLVGLSGLTEFPHVHFQLSRGDEIFDPWLGTPVGSPCGQVVRPMWDAETLARLPYRPASLYNAGFEDRSVEVADIRAGRPTSTELLAVASSITVWVEAYNVSEGDRVAFTVEGPAGFAPRTAEARLEKRQARIFRALAMSRPETGWPKGGYRATIRLLDADGALKDEIVREAEVR